MYRLSGRHPLLKMDNSHRITINKVKFSFVGYGISNKDVSMKYRLNNLCL
ncbi:hypothetical protein THOM_0345 [Trachipleistophora hominis]|uniref:Uncharacterized protein n=1 Tax=Trachipleistophora hominis TaxID=72359 RepID=L7JYW8_TRAHO|nr:hypothetical protein THOM_0345 [Trachipleistophora hominis]